MRTGPVIVFGSHGPVAASPPTSTRPVLPVIVSGPVIVAPQIRTKAAPFTVSGPVIRPPWMSSMPPGATVSGPVRLAPALTQTASSDATVSGPVWFVMHWPYGWITTLSTMEPTGKAGLAPLVRAAPGHVAALIRRRSEPRTCRCGCSRRRARCCRTETLT